MGSSATLAAVPTERLLLIDDDEDFCRLLSKRLAAEGYAVSWSTEATAIEELLHKTQPSAVILDMQLKDTEGLTVLEQIRKRDAEMPVIILTGYETVATAVRSMKAGAFHYLAKPVDVPELKAILETAIERKRAPQSDPSLMKAFDKAKKAAEKKLILETLLKTHWHQGKAASLLGVDPKTLYNKMKGYGISGR